MPRDDAHPTDPLSSDLSFPDLKAGEVFIDPSITDVDPPRDMLSSSTKLSYQINVNLSHQVSVPEDIIPSPGDENSHNPVVSPTYSSQIIASAKTGSLPDHLKFLPPSIPIPEGYTWVVIHGGWTLIPKVNSDKFVIPEQPPTAPLAHDPLDEELVDWEDDEEQEFLIDDFADGEDIPEECDDFADPAILESIVQQSEVGSAVLDISFNSQCPHGPTITDSHTSSDTQVRCSDMAKKPSTRWNEEAGFIPHPPKSSKKKIPEDPREGTFPQLHSSLNSWFDAQLHNYSNACGVKFLGSPQHKSKCFAIVKYLETVRSSSELDPEGTNTKTPNPSL